MKTYLKPVFVVLFLITAVFSSMAAYGESETQAPPPNGSQGKVISVQKPFACYINGTIKRDELAARLPGKVGVTVEKTGSLTEQRQAAVEWDMKNIPSVVDVDKAFVIHGNVRDKELEAEGIDTGDRSVQINVITMSPGPVTTLRGKARIVSELESEVELYLICPDSLSGFYIEYSTDRQEWKKIREGTNLWPEIAKAGTGRLDPESIKYNGEIKLVYRMDILRTKAKAGFWVRVRIEGSDHEGISNECRMTPKDKSFQAVSQPEAGKEDGWSQENFGLGDSGLGGLDQESGEAESASEPESESMEEETKKRRRPSGEESTEETEEESTEPTEPSGGGPGEKSAEGGGYAAGGVRYGGTYTEWGDEESDDEPGKSPWLFQAAAAVGIVGGICLVGFLVYKKFTKDE